MDTRWMKPPDHYLRHGALDGDNVWKKPPGHHRDSPNLYLQVKPHGSRSWIFRYRPRGNRYSRDMGLGPLLDVTLVDARKIAHELRGLLRYRIDPIEHRKAAEREKQAQAVAGSMTLEKCLKEFMLPMKHPKPKEQAHFTFWNRQFELHVYPFAKDVPVKDVDFAMILKILNPIHDHKTETANKLAAQLRDVLNYAKRMGYRDGDNPADKDALKAVFKKRKGRTKGHNAALPYDKVAGFMQALTDKGTIGCHALRFLILTATRTVETLRAEWSEIDFEKQTWTIPAARMTAKGNKEPREHAVPLSAPAIELLREMEKAKMSAYVFPGMRPQKPLSDNALLSVIGDLNKDRTWSDPKQGNKPITAHGFRSSFKDWATDNDCPDMISEMCLAHDIGNETKKAYLRSDLFDKRKTWMEQWGDFVSPPQHENVVEFKKTASK